MCVSDPARGGFQCALEDKVKFFLPYENSDHYVAVSPDDFRTLLEYAKTKCGAE